MSRCGKSPVQFLRIMALGGAFAAALLFSAGAASAAEEAAEVVRKYPPYPDVWGRVLPFPNDESYYLAQKAYEAIDGTLLFYIASSRRQRNDPLQISLFEFFENRFRKIDKNSAYQFRLANKERRRLNFKLMLPDGSRIENKSESFSNCRETWDLHIVKRDPDGRIVADKMLLALYDRPVRIELNPYCGLSGDSDFYVAHWRQIQPALALLKDETVLAYDSDGIFILRVKPDWTSPFLAEDGRLFLVDRDKVMKVVAGALRDRGAPPIQRVNDAVYRYLLNLKKETNR